VSEAVDLARIETLIERAVSALRAEIAARDRALVLQATEYERRLGILNGEHSTLRDMRGDFVLRVVYDGDLDQMRRAADLARRDADEQRALNTRAADANRRNTVGWILACAIAIVGWGITLVPKFLAAGR
jgi:hypothetical protein